MGDGRGGIRAIAAPCAVVFAAAGLACVGSPAEPPALELQPSQRVEIRDVVRVGPYRAADLVGAAGTMRFYFPSAGVCRETIREGASALYLPEGRFGGLIGAADGTRCEPVGVASLAAWRDQLPRRRSRYLRPRERATLRPAGSGPGVILARGALPLALELLLPQPEDLVAVLPDEAACRALLAARSGILEYGPEGPDPLVLRGPDGPCRIRGLALPLSLE